MILDDCATVYLYDKDNNTYTAHLVPCHWVDAQADTVKTTGQVNSGSVIVYIPISSAQFAPKSPTLDMLVRGSANNIFPESCDDRELSACVKALKSMYDIKVVQSVDCKNYSGRATGHFKVTAK